MSKPKKIDVNRIREVLDYDKDTGNFYWKVRVAKCVHIGDLAGHKSSDGYWRICLDKKLYTAHRLAWVHVNGSIPDDMQIDHVNLIKTDNRIDNLRLASSSTNQANTTHDRKAISPYRGVQVTHRKKHPWAAKIKIDGKLIHLGVFTNQEDAALAYNKAAVKHFGEFAQLNNLESVA